MSNMSVSMLAWIAQFAEASFRAVTRIEYRCATVREIKSTGASSTSVFFGERLVDVLATRFNDLHRQPR